MKKNKTLIIAILLILAFITITLLVLMDQTTNFDTFIYNILPKTQILTTFMKLITHLGSTIVLSTIAILLFLFIKNKKLSILFPANLMLVSGLNSILKFIIQRERPLNRLVSVTGFSFPSGHSASSIAFYGFLIYVIYKKCTNKTIKITLMTALGILIFLIGLSRIYLHVHYPSDVLGGFTYSLAYLIIFINFTEKHIFKNNQS